MASQIGKEINVLGLMSGTSLDGVDLALCNFKNTTRKTTYKLLGAKTIEYPYYLREKLQDALNISTQDLHYLDQELADFYSAIVMNFIDDLNTKPKLIASHGHTILHQPDKGITLQIGDGDVIAQKTGIIVINDFRLQDVSKGGQGAPLVPVGDRDLFGEYDFCLNLGGIANVSFNHDNKRIACDIVPCNMALNTIMSWINIDYDKNGDMAASGTVDNSLLAKLNGIEYYRNSPPKSLGKEWFMRKFLPILEESRLGIEDLLQTVCQHIADQVSGFMNEYCTPGARILVTGGGVYNKTLMESIQKKCTAKIVIPDEDLINFKEAIVFAYLGLLRYKNEINVLSSVTGAETDTCAGIINYPNK